jgi:hypothetical protein
MNYHFAKSEFESLLNEINDLLRKPKIEFREAEPLAQKTGVYIKNLFAPLEEERKAYQRNFNRNEEVSRINPIDRMINCRSLIETILVDINQNIRSNSNPVNDTSSLEEQLNRVKFELTNAENEKAKLRQEIQRLETKTAANINEFDKSQEQVGKLNREQEHNDKFPADLSEIIIQKLEVIGLKPQQFTRSVTYGTDAVAYGIHYKNSPMYFKFHQLYDGSNFETVSFTRNTPKYTSALHYVKRNNPAEAYTIFEQWLNSHLLDYRNKFDKPDPWNQVIESPDSNNLFDENEQPFKEDEIDFLKRRLDVLESVAAQEIDLHTDEIQKLKNAIEGLKEQLSKLSKPIWRRVAASVLQEVITDPEKSHKMFEIVKDAFEDTKEIFRNLLNP